MFRINISKRWPFLQSSLLRQRFSSAKTSFLAQRQHFARRHFSDVKSKSYSSPPPPSSSPSSSSSLSSTKLAAEAKPKASSSSGQPILENLQDQLHGFMARHQISTMKGVILGAGTLVGLGGFGMYMFGGRVKDEVVEQTASIAHRSLNDKEFVAQINRTSQELVQNILSNQLVLDQASVFVQRLVEQERTRTALVNVVKVTLKDQTTYDTVLGLANRLVASLLADDKTRDLVADLVRRVLVLPENKEALYQIVSLFLNDPKTSTLLQNVLSRAVHDVLNDDNVRDHAIRFVKDVLSDHNLQQKGGDALWGAASNAFVPSWFRRTPPQSPDHPPPPRIQEIEGEGEGEGEMEEEKEAEERDGKLTAATEAGEANQEDEEQQEEAKEKTAKEEEEEEEEAAKGELNDIDFEQLSDIATVSLPRTSDDDLEARQIIDIHIGSEDKSNLGLNKSQSDLQDSGNIPIDVEDKATENHLEAEEADEPIMNTIAPQYAKKEKTVHSLHRTDNIPTIVFTKSDHMLDQHKNIN